MNFLPTVREGVVRTPGADVTYYDSAGPDDPRTPVVLLHGTGGSAASHFWALFPMLAERHRVIALDFADPGAEVEEQSGVGALAEQVEAVIAELSPRRTVGLVGYSLGAVVAAAVAGRRPDVVDHLVLVAGWLRTDQHQRLRNAVWWKLHEAGSALPEFSVFTAYSPTYLLSRTPAELAYIVRRAGTGPDRTAAMRLNRHVDITAEVASIEAPTLVVGCADDQMVPVHHSRLLFGGIRNARYLELRSGHAVVHERPAELFRVVSHFIEQPGRNASGDILVPESV